METIGKYQIVEKIAAGGMATVYKGIQPSLNRPVAVKLLHQQFSDNSQVVVRFNRESLIIARLAHPNIIHVIDRGITDQGRPYFVMDFIQGTDVSALIKQNSLDINRKLDILIQVCKALSYAHKNGVIHRDIKPANILIDTEGNALVTDFGIAQFYDGSDEAAHELTQENIIMGTLAYMSPEQKTDSNKITLASDLFSLGVVMYELCTGGRPQENFKPPSAVNPKLPKALDDLVRTCLEPDPNNRPASADAVRDRLLELLQGAHIKTVQKQAAIQGVPKMEEIFTLLDIIKENQFGTVYLFRHKVNEELMVVKRYNIPTGGLKAAKLLTNLRHPHIVDILGVSGSKTQYIIVMEYLNGGCLADRMLAPHQWDDALDILRPVCEALAFAHRNRIVHGNLRPSNILFSDGGEIKVADFGLNEHYAMDPDKANWYATVNQPKTRQADIYAVGAILYKMLTGKVPVLKGNGFLAAKSFKALPKDIQRFTARLLTQEARLRFSSMDQVVEAIANLRKAIQDQPTQVFEMSASKNRKAAASPRKGRFRPAQTFILLLLLVAAAGIYIGIHLEDSAYIEAIRHFEGTVLKAVKSYFPK